MRTLRAVGVVGAALGGALGIGLFACGGGSSGVGDAAEGGLPGDDGAAPRDGGTGADGSVVHLSPGTCTNPVPVVIGGKNTGFVRCEEGYQHRATIADCPSLAPRASSQCGGGGGKDAGMECGDDSDCTAKPNGICRASTGGAFFCGCAYGCVRDSDCAAGQLCECGDPVGFCVTTKCTDDTKCAAPSLCASVPAGFGGCGGEGTAYLCQTSADRCDVASDCPMKDGGQPQICGYDADAGARGCGEGPLACPGRPFLVDSAPRVASLAIRGDWHAPGFVPHVSGLPADVRAALAEHWARAGQMEHASVAAFARFALELLALGAPAWAIVETNAAMAEETEHARITFALASAYAGRALGPSPLSIDGALGSVTDRSVFATLVREGCIGETIAAISATDALEAAEDVAVREALARIAADETRHAALAWRVARWLVARGDTSFGVWAGEEIARAVAERAASGGAATQSSRTVAEGSAHARAHGLGDARTEAALVRAALRDLVVPCAAAMFDAPAVDAPSHRAVS